MTLRPPRRVLLLPRRIPTRRILRLPPLALALALALIPVAAGTRSGLLPAPLVVHASTLGFVVTSTADAPDAHPGDGVCADAAGRCTLRAAIQEGNAQPAASSISIAVPPGHYRLTLGAIALTAHNNFAVGGKPGAAARTVIDGGGVARLFTVAAGAGVAFSDLTLTGGKAVSGAGGALANAGDSVLISCVLAGNSAPAGNGGGIANAAGAHLGLVSSQVMSNTAPTGNGGGIDNAGMLTLNGVTVSGNSANAGGGLDNESNASASVTGSTLNANHAGYGGGLDNLGQLTLRDSTLSGNTATRGAGGLATGAGAHLSYSTLAGNAGNLVAPPGTTPLVGMILAGSTSGPNCGGPVADGGFNLDSGASCGFTQTSDMTNTNPLLGPLQNNGGPTPTMALLAGSPAIDAGSTAAQGCPATDQRGKGRPDGAETRCDMGAFETQGAG